MTLSAGRILKSLMVGFILTSSSPQVATAESAPATQQTAKAKRLHARSTSFSELDSLPAGIASNGLLVFVGVPLEGRVAVISRVTGRQVAELPVPPSGFVLPFIVHSLGPGRIGVLDAGGLPSPSPFVPANPTIYEYSFSLSARDGFSAEITRTVSFASETIGFAEDFVQLDDGRYLLSDAVLGAIWSAETDGTISPALVPEGPMPSQAIPELAVCPTMPLIEVGGLPFLFSGSTKPGVSPLAVRAGRLYFYSPCAEGLFSIPLASLFDETRAPHERAEDIELVSPKPAGVAVEQLLALTFNPNAPQDRFLYAADSLQLRLVRIDTTTGERQVVDDDPTLFNFPSSIAFAPSLLGLPTLLTVSNQQHRTALTNDAIDEDVSQLPYIVTKTVLKN